MDPPADSTATAGSVPKVRRSIVIPAWLYSHGNPYISFYDGATGVLKVVHRKNDKWWSEIVDQNYAGMTSSLAIDRDTLWVSYGDELGRSLKVAYRPLEPASATQAGAASVSKVK